MWTPAGRTHRWRAAAAPPLRPWIGIEVPLCGREVFETRTINTMYNFFERIQCIFKVEYMV
jgi:hypothetical protein